MCQGFVPSCQGCKGLVSAPLEEASSAGVRSAAPIPVFGKQSISRAGSRVRDCLPSPVGQAVNLPFDRRLVQSQDPPPSQVLGDESSEGGSLDLPWAVARASRPQGPEDPRVEEAELPVCRQLASRPLRGVAASSWRTITPSAWKRWSGSSSRSSRSSAR